MTDEPNIVRWPGWEALDKRFEPYAVQFEDRRNNALHTPFTFLIDASGPHLTSKWFSGHARAEKLKDKDLLQEFEWYGRTANALAIYTRRMSASLRDASVIAWPERPDLPKLGQI